MKWYGRAKPSPSLFVHFDKNVYANNEMVYFTAYLLKMDSTARSRHNVLSVALIRDADSTVILQDKFLIQDGLAFGNIMLLDKILSGNYHLVAFTNSIVNGWPELVFKQAILIKTSLEPPFSANIKLLNDKESKKKALISITSTEGRFLTKPIVISYQYGNFKGTTKADASGQFLLTLPDEENLINPNLHVKIKYERDSSFISLPIPRPKHRAFVKFYPEGGKMVVGMRSTIAWEVLDQNRLPLLLKAFLFKNNTIIDTIETNNYGIGKFRLFPEANCTYTVKLVHSALVDSTYLLPKAINEGIILNVPNAVVTNTLKFFLKSNAHQKLLIRVHNFRTCFLTAPLKMEPALQSVKISLLGIPKGLVTLTISDEQDRPLAERMFFAHYNPNQQLELTSDKAVYKQREKVTLKIKLQSPEDNAVVSVACVQNSRLSPSNLQDIASFSYLTDELNQLPVQLNGNPMTDKAYMEQILMVKGWRKYNWNDLEETARKEVVFSN